MNPSGREPLRVRIVRAFTERLMLKGTAIGLAILVWFIISVKEPTLDYVAARFQPILDSSMVLRQPLPEIYVWVSGAPGDVVRLRARPPLIRPQITADSPDTLVLDLKASDVQLPDNLRVDRIEPTRITLRFEPTSTRRVPVTPNVRVTDAAGDSVAGAEVIVEPATVEVNGPRLVVSRTSLVRTERLVIAADDSLPHLVSIDTTGMAAVPKPNQVTVRIRRAGVNGSGRVVR